MFLFKRLPVSGSRWLAIICLLALSLFSGCKDVTNPADSNENEVITTAQLKLANQADSTDNPEATIKFKEGFGHGDALEIMDTLKLKAGATYSSELLLLNEVPKLVEVISEEVKAEGIDHQVFYLPAGIALTVTYRDSDATHLPIGLLTHFTTGLAGTGTLKVTLKHQPGLKSPTSTVATGETDVEVSFPVTIQ